MIHELPDDLLEPLAVLFGNGQRVVDHYDRVNAQSIRLGDRLDSSPELSRISHLDRRILRVFQILCVYNDAVICSCCLPVARSLRRHK